MKNTCKCGHLKEEHSSAKFPDREWCTTPRKTMFIWAFGGTKHCKCQHYEER